MAIHDIAREGYDMMGLGNILWNFYPFGVK